VKPTRSHGRVAVAATAKPRELIQERPQLQGAWAATVLTLYPEMFPGTLGHSLIGKALDQGLWSLNTINIRDHAHDRHRTVDDTPAGGGAGMVLKADVLSRALAASPRMGPVLYMSPRGRPFTQAMAHDLAAAPGATILCGRFEGVDQRVLDAHDVTEVSIGDFVLTGGEIAAQALIDATVRLIPRVLGNTESSADESFSNGLLEYPQYTRPTDWDGSRIPDILLSGHHGRIAAWRQAQSEALTKERRPDLWRAYLARRDGTDPERDQEPSGGFAQHAQRKKKKEDCNEHD